MPRSPISKKPLFQQLADVIVVPAVDRWLADRGMVRGDLSGGRNFYDVLQDRAFQTKVHDAMFGAATGDRPVHERLFRGLAATAGVPWTPALQRTASESARALSEISPYMQRFAPDVWDQLHGEQGSTAALTHAIAEAHKGQMDPMQALETAKQVRERLYSDTDPLKTRGFSMRQMGEMYKEMARRGMVSPGATPAEVAKRLSDYAGPLSAARDLLSPQGGEPPMEDMFEATQAAHRMFDEPYLPPRELESRMRQEQDIMQRGGPLFAAGLEVPFGQSRDEINVQDRALRQQAVASPMSNYVGATERLSQQTPFATGSPAAKLLDQYRKGQAPPPATWLTAMQQSGVDPALAGLTLSQQAANRRELTPALVDTVRRNQRDLEIQPLLDRYRRMYGGNQSLMAGAQEEVASQLGYQDAQAMNALHGPATMGVKDVMQEAQQRGDYASKLSPLGQAKPLARITDALSKPQGASVKQLMGAAFNVVPPANIPKPAAPLRLP